LIMEEVSENNSRKGCDDLDNGQVRRFKELQVESTDEHGELFMRDVRYFGDLIQWLNTQVKR